MLNCSPRQIPTVHREDRARYERGLVGGEEEDGVRHLCRFAEPPYRVRLPHRGYVLLGQFHEGLCRYRAWRSGLTRVALAAHSTARCLVIPEGTNLAGP